MRNEKDILLNESNDCTVVALSQAFDIPYENVHELCKKFGRKDGQGFHIQAKLLGHLKDKLTIRPTWFGFSLRVFLKVMNDNKVEHTFIILVKGHMLCVKNGKRMDGGTDNNVRIERCFLVKR